jgi:hypothetical protein
MSFLSDNHSEFLSARITQKGRNAIAKGNFNIEYFQIGDSEFDYSSNFSLLTGSITHQKVFSPLDHNTNVKYPIGYDADLTTTYGEPVQFSEPYTIRNVMGPAGFISGSGYNISGSITGATISCVTSSISPSEFDGGSSINVNNGNLFQNCDYLTIIFGNISSSYVTTNYTSLIYKITNISGSVIHLDRNLPTLSGISGTAICNKCEMEFPDLDSYDTGSFLPMPIDTEGQLNPWTLNTIWTTKPIGADYGGNNENLNGYESNRYVSIKEYLGYTSTGQTFTDISGNTILFTGSLINTGSISGYTGFSTTSIGSAYVNSYDEYVEVKPNEQRCIAIIHYSELGDTIADPERFFKYDDYISDLTLTGDTVAFDYNESEISDTEYFEVFIPYIQYHRNTGSTIGAYFKMDIKDFYLKPSEDLSQSRFELKYRYLLDESGFIVGKVFIDNKVIIFDDQELVALLDYRSNRRFSLPAPKVNFIPSDTTSSNSLITGTNSETYWVTYMLSNQTSSSSKNYLPCNYYSKIEVNYDTGSCNIPYPSNISMKFDNNSFNYLDSGQTLNYTAKHFYGLVQKVNTQNELPLSNNWKLIHITGSDSNYLYKSDLENKTFTITKNMYDSGVPFDLENFMSSGYLGVSGSQDFFTTGSQFGDEQPFPGSVKLVRATDVEQMNFLINLPAGKFGDGNTQGYSQNPTFITGSGKYPYITEIGLLDSGKNPLVVAKTPTPIRRTGTQVFSVKLDF